MSAKRTRTAGKAKEKSPPPSAGGRVPFTDRPLKFEFLVALLIMIAAICVLYPELVFKDDVFFASDNQAAASFSSVGKASLAEGVYPVWNPYIFAGMPCFASLQYTPYVYPITPILIVLRRILFIPSYSWLFFHTLLIGMGTFLLLRMHRAHFLAAVSAGVLMMWMPNLVAVGANGHGTQACASGYLPFALLFWERIWRGRGTVVNAAALVIVLGLSMLRAHLQISYYTYALVALYVLFYGVARVLDGVKGRRPEASMLPRRWMDKLTAGSGYTARTAFAEFAWAAAVFGIVVLGSLMMSAVLHLPVHDYAQYSVRGASAGGGADYNYATSWSLHPLEMLTFVLPYAYGFGKDLYFGHMPFTDYPNYLGLVVVAFAVASMFLVRTRYVKFLAFVTAVATFVSFGKFFPILYKPLFEFAPFFNKFRVPVMVLIVQQLAVVLMFGMGLDAVLRLDRTRGRSLAIKAGAVGIVLLVVAVALYGYFTGGFADSIVNKMRFAQTAQQQVALAHEAGSRLATDTVRLAVMFLVCSALLFLFFTNRRVPALVFAGGIVLVAALDFYLVDANILHPERFRGHERLRIIRDESVLERHTEPDSVISFLQGEKRRFRVFPMDSPRQPFGGMFQSNRYMNFGISSIGGYHAAKLAVYEEYFRAMVSALSRGNFQLVDALNVRYIVSGARLPEHPRFRLAFEGVDAASQRQFVYENMAALPRVFFVDRYRVESKENALSLLSAASVDLREEAILEDEPAIEPKSREGASGAVTEYKFDEIRVDARTEQPCLMVLSEVYYPKWKATVDGVPTEVLQADHILRAVALPAGQHEVVFRYDMTLLERGLVISVATFSAALLILIGSFFVSRRRMRGSADLHTDVQ